MRLYYLLKKNKVTVLCILFFCISYTLFAAGKREEVPIKEKIIGISLPDQRSVRWVRVRNAFYEYAKEHNIPVKIRFSDDDRFLQAFQIRALSDGGIDFLIVFAPHSQEIKEALEYASQKGVFIIVVNTLVFDTEAVDFYVAFDLNKLGLSNSSKLINIDELKEVIAGEKEFTWLLSPSLLAETSLILANEFSDELPKEQDYPKVHNNTKSVPTHWVNPVAITATNYKALLIDSKLVKEKDLE